MTVSYLPEAHGTSSSTEVAGSRRVQGSVDWFRKPCAGRTAARSPGRLEGEAGSQSEEEAGAGTATRPLLDTCCPIQVCEVGQQPEKLRHAEKP